MSSNITEQNITVQSHQSPLSQMVERCQWTSHAFFKKKKYSKIKKCEANLQLMLRGSLRRCSHHHDLFKSSKWRSATSCLSSLFSQAKWILHILYTACAAWQYASNCTLHIFHQFIFKRIILQLSPSHPLCLWCIGVMLYHMVLILCNCCWWAFPSSFFMNEVLDPALYAIRHQADFSDISDNLCFVCN